MMRRTGFLSTFGLIGLLAVTSASLAQTSPDAPPSVPTAAALQKEIGGFDPRAVAAAKSYFEKDAVKVGLISVVDSVNQQVLALVGKENPKLTPAQSIEVQTVVRDAMKERLDLLIQMNILIALKTFTADELVALDKFYASPEGSAILVKMPKMMSQVPSVVQALIPDYLAEIKAKLKAANVEVDL
jgi:hypothetical protein